MSGITTQVLWILELCCKWQKFLQRTNGIQKKLGKWFRARYSCHCQLFFKQLFSINACTVISSGHESSGYQYHMPLFESGKTTHQQDPRYYSILHPSQEHESLRPMEGVRQPNNLRDLKCREKRVCSRWTVSEIEMLTSVPLLTRLRKWNKPTTY